MSKPPCDCIKQVNGRWTYRCECLNGGDAENAAYWVADENNQAEITALLSELEDALADANHDKQQIKENTEVITALRAEVSNLKGVTRHYKEQAEALRAEVERLSAVVLEWKASSDDANGRLGATLVENERLRAELADFRRFVKEQFGYEEAAEKEASA